MKEVKCRKLVAPTGRSFRKSCAAEAKDIFFCNENMWPDGAELRDWYVSSKRTDSAATAPKVLTVNGC